jgi:integrase
MDKPEMFKVGRVSVRPVRGPREDGRWYWRAILRREDKCEPAWKLPGDEAEQHFINALGSNPHSAQSSPESTSWTVGMLVDYWAGAEEDLVGAGRSKWTAEARRFAAVRIRKLIGDIRIDRYDERAARRFVDLARRTYAPRTVRLDQTCLGLAWEWGRLMGHIPDRTFPKVKISIPKSEPYTPTREEVLLVLHGFRVPSPKKKTLPPEWMRRAVWLYWATGCRRGELEDVRWRDVDLERGVMRVVGKTGERWVELPDVAVAEMRTWTRAHPEARVWDRAPATIRSSLTVTWHRVCRLVGVRPFVFQALRRHATDALYDAGADPGVESAQIGHSAQVAIGNYRKARKNKVREVLNRSGLGVVPAGDVIEVDFTEGTRK